MSLSRRLKSLPGVASAVWHVDHLFDLLHDLQRRQRDSASDNVLLFEAMERVLIRLAEISSLQADAQRRAEEIEERLEEVRAMLTRLDGQFGSHLRGLDEKFNRTRPGVYLAALGVDVAEPEASLLQFLASELRVRAAIDVGAGSGQFARKLLDVGVPVFALEPAPDFFEALTAGLGMESGFRALPLAAGASDGEMDLALRPHAAAGPSSLLSRMAANSRLGDYRFRGTASVPLRRLGSLIEEGTIPAETGILRIAAASMVSEVIHGLGALRAEVVQVKYRDRGTERQPEVAKSDLKVLTAELRSLGFARHIVFARPEGGPVVHYANLPSAIPGSWGYATFFREEAAFQSARRWCEAVLPSAYLYRE